MKLSDFDYHLPPELIAQEGLSERDLARMMVLRPSGQIEHGTIRDLLIILKEGDVMVLNDTRVAKARLLGKKDTGRKVDCLIVRDGEEKNEKEVLLRGKAFKKGSQMEFQGATGRMLSAEVLEWLGGGG